MYSSDILSTDVSVVNRRTPCHLLSGASAFRRVGFKAIHFPCTYLSRRPRAHHRRQRLLLVSLVPRSLWHRVQHCHTDPVGSEFLHAALARRCLPSATGLDDAARHSAHRSVDDERCCDAKSKRSGNADAGRTLVLRSVVVVGGRTHDARIGLAGEDGGVDRYASILLPAQARTGRER